MVSSEHLPSASAELALNLTSFTSFLIRIILDEPYLGVFVSNVSARGSQFRTKVHFFTKMNSSNR